MRFDSNEFQSALTSLCACLHRGASDIDEVLATTARIKDGDADSWVLEWIATAGEVWARAKAEARAGRRENALACFRRAASYYDAALALIARSAECDRRMQVWRRQRTCWERVVDLSPARGERIAIPYLDTTLPGYFFAAPCRGRRPLVIMNNGSVSCTSQMWVRGGAAAAERGYHWMTFDGPGQQSALIEQGLPARPDWEAVLSRVIDAMSARHEVDATRIAVVGVDEGGYWVPRALAFEHRAVAAVADPGLVDLSARWKWLLPCSMRQLLDSDHDGEFEQQLRIELLFSPTIAATLRELAEPYGPANGSLATSIKAVETYRLERELSDITTPLLVTQSAPNSHWSGQPQRLFDRLPGRKALILEPRNPMLRETKIFEWLDVWLAPA
jgi:Esterase FrsA-like